MSVEVERTKPGSKNDWRVTYDTGSKKWTNDRPGDGEGDGSGDLLKRTLKEPSVQRGLKSIQKAIEGGKSVEEPVRGFVRDVGSERGTTVLNAIVRTMNENLKDCKDGCDMKKRIRDGWAGAKGMVSKVAHAGIVEGVMDRFAGIKDEVDLRKEYSKYNKMYFNGDLPANLNLGWNRSKQAGGVALGTLNRRTGEITPEAIKISTFLKMDMERFKKILLHEMIHIWMFVKNDNSGHGAVFKSLARQIGSKAGLVIPLTEDISGMEVSDEVKATEYVAVLFGSGSLDKMALFYRRTFDKVRDEVESWAQRKADVTENYQAEFIRSNYRDLMKFPAMRKMPTSGMKYYRVEPAIVKGIRESGEVIGQIKSGEKSPQMERSEGLLRGVGKFLARSMEKRFGVPFTSDMTVMYGQPHLVVTPNRGRGSIEISVDPYTKESTLRVRLGVKRTFRKYYRIPTPQTVNEFLDSVDGDLLMQAFGVERSASNIVSRVMDRIDSDAIRTLWHENSEGEKKVRAEFERVAGPRDVLKRIVQVVRDKGRVMDMADRVDELTQQEQRMVYSPVDYGDMTDLSKKRKMDIGWTDHAEYRSDLRDVDPDQANQAISEVMRKKLQPQKGKKPKMKSKGPEKMKAPGVGTMVVDYDLTRQPAEADVVTVWAKERGMNIEAMNERLWGLLAQVESQPRTKVASKLRGMIATLLNSQDGILMTADEMESYCPDCARQIREGSLQMTYGELRRMIGPSMVDRVAERRIAAVTWEKDLKRIVRGAKAGKLKGIYKKVKAYLDANVLPRVYDRFRENKIYSAFNWLDMASIRSDNSGSMGEFEDAFSNLLKEVAKNEPNMYEEIVENLPIAVDVGEGHYNFLVLVPAMKMTYDTYQRISGTKGSSYSYKDGSAKISAGNMEDLERFFEKNHRYIKPSSQAKKFISQWRSRGASESRVFTGADKWKKMPKGWTDESRKKFWDSLTSRAPKHKVTQCIKQMKGKVDDPGAFCASLADSVNPGWRQEAQKDKKAAERVALDLGDSLLKLAKFNDGLWQSERQARFILNNMPNDNSAKAKAWASSNGMKGDHYFTSFIDLGYGRKDPSKIRFSGRVFVVDGGGVVGVGKVKVIHFKKGVRDFDLDWSDTEVLFRRTAKPEIVVDPDADRAAQIRANQPLIKAIKSIPDWDKKDILSDFVTQLEYGHELTPRQMDVVRRMTPLKSLPIGERSDWENAWKNYRTKMLKYVFPAYRKVVEEEVTNDLPKYLSDVDKSEQQFRQKSYPEWWLDNELVYALEEHLRVKRARFMGSGSPMAELALEMGKLLGSKKRPTKRQLAAIDYVNRFNDRVSNQSAYKAFKKDFQL